SHRVVLFRDQFACLFAERFVMTTLVSTHDARPFPGRLSPGSSARATWVGPGHLAASLATRVRWFPGWAGNAGQAPRLNCEVGDVPVCTDLSCFSGGPGTTRLPDWHACGCGWQNVVAHVIMRLPTGDREIRS